MSPRKTPPVPAPLKPVRGTLLGSGNDKGNWIAGATKNKGGLHRSLGVPEGQTIPAKKLNKAAASGSPRVRKQANLAKTLKGLR